jgi:hypothetical protein
MISRLRDAASGIPRQPCSWPRTRATYRPAGTRHKKAIPTCPRGRRAALPRSSRPSTWAYGQGRRRGPDRLEAALRATRIACAGRFREPSALAYGESAFKMPTANQQNVNPLSAGISLLIYRSFRISSTEKGSGRFQTPHSSQREPRSAPALRSGIHVQVLRPRAAHCGF